MVRAREGSSQDWRSGFQPHHRRMALAFAWLTNHLPEQQLDRIKTAIERAHVDGLFDGTRSLQEVIQTIRTTPSYWS